MSLTLTNDMSGSPRLAVGCPLDGSPQPLAAQKLKKLLEKPMRRLPGVHLDYLEFFDSNSLLPAASVGRGTQMALAVFVGTTRLIDNGKI